MENQSVVKNGGGQGGIRTLGTLSRTHAFQACALNHSATCPCHGVICVLAQISRSGRIYTDDFQRINRNLTFS